ncbi:hypothetical protein [Nocardia xishanensis]
MDRLTARFEELASVIAIPYPWDASAYVARVAEYRGRAIQLCPIDPEALAGTGCGTGAGLWIAREHDDVIMYGGETPWHNDQIIAHEIGHMLLGHGLDNADNADDAADLPLHELMPSLSADAIRSVLRRDDYGSDREHDAEAFADLLMVHAMLPRRRASRLRSTFFRTRHR